jgi:hypothetical protein
MKIMSVDPGITTGIFFFDTVTEEKWGREVPASIMDEVVEHAKPEFLIVERKPYNEKWDIVLRKQYENITVMLPAKLDITLKLITPGLWKPVVKAMKWKVTGVSQHVKDAYNILRYAVLVHLNHQMEDFNKVEPEDHNVKG